MSLSYAAVGWNRQKRLYDGVMVGGVLAFLGIFYVAGKYLGASPALPPTVTGSGGGAALAGGGSETFAARSHDDAMLVLRGLGVCGLMLLHVVLWIGPLARLDRRFLPLLYNRRHLGVCTFLVGLAHATITIVQYHAFGDVNPLVSVLVSNTNYLSLAAFPFEVLGVGALVILFLMAATSHDFWLSVLSARVWKWLHMGVYVAYALLVMHVMLGALQQERSPMLLGVLVGGVATTVSLHIAAGRRELAREGSDSTSGGQEAGLIDAGTLSEIEMDRARVVCPGAASPNGGERIAVFKYTKDGATCVSAVANVCVHQQGPLGEGKVIDGCITCPWHGYQYRPGDGCAPPPFTEKLPTYRVTLRGDRIYVDPRPQAAGTAVEPARVEGAGGGGEGRVTRG